MAAFPELRLKHNDTLQQTHSHGAVSSQTPAPSQRDLPVST